MRVITFKSTMAFRVEAPNQNCQTLTSSPKWTLFLPCSHLLLNERKVGLDDLLHLLADFLQVLVGQRLLIACVWGGMSAMLHVHKLNWGK